MSVHLNKEERELLNILDKHYLWRYRYFALDSDSCKSDLGLCITTSFQIGAIRLTR